MFVTQNRIAEDVRKIQKDSSSFIEERNRRSRMFKIGKSYSLKQNNRLTTLEIFKLKNASTV